MTPRASIILTTRDERPEWLAQALTSALDQTVPIEVILVDDGSVASFDVSGPCVRMVRHEESKGIAAALNAGVREARTDWVCWLPSDDIFYPTKVQDQLSALEHLGAYASFHMYHAFHLKPEHPHAVSAHWDWRSQLLQQRQLGVGCAINGLTVMLHKQVFDKVGGFDESYQYAQDWEYWCRVTQTYEWLPMRDVLAARRQSGENLTARIEMDPVLKAIRDEEDQRVRRQYGLPGGA